MDSLRVPGLNQIAASRSTGPTKDAFFDRLIGQQPRQPNAFDLAAIAAAGGAEQQLRSPSRQPHVGGTSDLVAAQLYRAASVPSPQNILHAPIRTMAAPGQLSTAGGPGVFSAPPPYDDFLTALSNACAVPSPSNGFRAHASAADVAAAAAAAALVNTGVHPEIATQAAAAALAAAAAAAAVTSGSQFASQQGPHSPPGSYMLQQPGGVLPMPNPHPGGFSMSPASPSFLNRPPGQRHASAPLAERERGRSRSPRRTVRSPSEPDNKKSRPAFEDEAAYGLLGPPGSPVPNGTPSPFSSPQNSPNEWGKRPRGSAASSLSSSSFSSSGQRMAPPPQQQLFGQRGQPPPPQQQQQQHGAQGRGDPHVHAQAHPRSSSCSASGRSSSTSGSGAGSGSHAQSPSPPAVGGAAGEKEEDPHRLRQRQKQIDYGKNTRGYDRYVQLVPKHRRRRGDARTPDKYMKCSKRAWDGLIRKWRRELHKWDPPGEPSAPDLPEDGESGEESGGGEAEGAAAVPLEVAGPGEATEFDDEELDRIISGAHIGAPAAASAALNSSMESFGSGSRTSSFGGSGRQSGSQGCSPSPRTSPAAAIAARPY
eukprot:tig00021623_g23017.t1